MTSYIWIHYALLAAIYHADGEMDIRYFATKLEVPSIRLREWLHKGTVPAYALNEIVADIAHQFQCDFPALLKMPTHWTHSPMCHFQSTANEFLKWAEQHGHPSSTSNDDNCLTFENTCSHFKLFMQDKLSQPK